MSVWGGGRGGSRGWDVGLINNKVPHKKKTKNKKQMLYYDRNTKNGGEKKIPRNIEKNKRS